MENQILEKFKSIETGSAFIGSNIKELEKEYPDQFVAIKESEVIANDVELDNLILKIKERKVNPQDTLIEFIPVKDEIILF